MVRTPSVWRTKTGLVTTRLFDVRLLEDPAPQVNLERPSASLDSLAVLPHAEITVQVVVDDGQCPSGVPAAVRTAYLEYRTQKDEIPRRLLLADHRAAELVVPRLGMLLASAPFPHGLAAFAGAPGSALAFRARPPRLQLAFRLPLKQVRHADGSELREGDGITLVACAVDFDNVALDKQPGRSFYEVERIVSRSHLEAALHQGAGPRAARAASACANARTRPCTRWTPPRNNASATPAGSGPEDLENLLQAGETQKEIRGRVGGAEDGLRAEVKRILQSAARQPPAPLRHPRAAWKWSPASWNG